MLERSRQLHRLQRIIDTQTAIVQSDLNLAAFMQMIVDTVQELTEAKGAVIEFVEDEWMVYRCASGLVAPHVGFRLNRKGSLSGLCVEAGLALRCDDTENDDRVDRAACRRVGVSSMICSPLFQDGAPIGVLKVMSDQLRGFDADDEQTLNLLAGMLGAALGKQVAFDNLRQAEMRLRLLTEQLRAGSEEIARKNVELEQASKAKSEFLANMSHELRTPLNSIIGFADVLKAGIGGSLSPKQLVCLEHVSQAGQHLLAVINDILDLSKVEAGRMSLELAEVELGIALATSLGILKEKASARHLSFVLDVDNALGTVLLDERKLKQILYNLISNAIKFSKEGTEIRVTARCVAQASVGVLDPAHATRVLQEVPQGFDAFIALSVADQGIGISQAGLDRLFEPFSQVDSGLSRKFEGTGLGLVMVARLAELHGGVVGVSSREGEGSCFTVWLPLRRTAEAAQSAAESVHMATRLGSR